MPRHVRLKFDKLRERWLLLAPERILVPDDTSVEVLQQCDGETSITEMVTILAAKYDAPEAEILGDVLSMLQELADKGFLAEIKEATS
nr:pyrroloquinoline quinone biosynthesis peptide chaperone PqqD [Roseovarius sp. M141]